MLVRRLSHNRRFANARRAPNHRGNFHLVLNQLVEIVCQFGRFHTTSISVMSFRAKREISLDTPRFLASVEMTALDATIELKVAGNVISSGDVLCRQREISLDTPRFLASLEMTALDATRELKVAGNVISSGDVLCRQREIS